MVLKRGLSYEIGIDFKFDLQFLVLTCSMSLFTTLVPSCFSMACISHYGVCLQALAGGPLVQARNFAVMTGVNAGISCVMKRLRGKEDVQNRLIIGIHNFIALALNCLGEQRSSLFFALACLVEY